MRIRLLAAAGVLLAGLAVWPAQAADKDPAKKKGPFLRYQHSYAAALEEAKDRGCVIFATFHIDH
jgi:hypothetical protein